jgi:hypothetical protein
MWTNTIEGLCHITVVAKELKIGWKIVLHNPAINMESSDGFTMLIAIVIDVV